MSAKKFSFKGGCFPLHHRQQGKAPTSALPIENADVPSQVVVPLRQHIGAPCQSLVKAGDSVRMGQLIGQSKAFVSANVHAPVSGTVKLVGMAPATSQQSVPCIVIENDGLDTPDEALLQTGKVDLASADAKTLLARVQQAGIVGMGGATFPAHVKLSPDTPVDVLLVNGAECEPYATCDERLMCEEPETIVRGIQIALRILGAERALVGIEKNKPEAIAAMRAACAQDARIEVVPLRVKYPQGSELHLMYTLTGRKVRVGERPTHAGVVVQNVGTLHAVARAVDEHMPLISRVVTVTGAVKQPRNLRVRIGTPFSALLAQCGGMTCEGGKVIAGGPMTGPAQHTLEVPVAKGTTAVLVLPPAEAALPEAGPCIRCGRCVDICPMGLEPIFISAYMLRDETEKLEGLHADACIACGSCSFICPAKLPLTQGCVLARDYVRKHKAKA